MGGRIYTVPSAVSELPVELGAEFVHGLPEELIELVDEAGLTRFELDGDSLCFRGAGPLQPCGEQRGVHEIFEALVDFAGSAETGDLSFADFVAQSGVDREAAAWATNYVEGFNAAEADRISVRSLARQQAAENAIDGDRIFRVMEGYARVPEFLLRRFCDAGGEYFPSMPVRSIDWQPGKVDVVTEFGRVFSARAAVLTLPLGVLQARQVRFRPEPAEMLQLADSLAMGPAARVVYEFDGGFWERFNVLAGLSFFFAPEQTPPTWWTTHPRQGATLTGWIAGRKAKDLEVGWLPGKGIDTLATVLAAEPDEVERHLVRSHTHDWQSDPRSRGAYTYVLRGSIDASERMSVPVEQTLFFAGEHTDTSGHWGTVHGALRSGYRAARQLLSLD